MKNSILSAFTILAIFVNLAIASNQFRLKFTEPSIPIIIDTDGDSDDFLAIVYALKSKELDVRGITYQGSGWSHAGIY